MAKVKIGIIGGSGLDDPGLMKDIREKKVKTPYGQLGILYDDVLGRTEEAAAFHCQAADKYAEIRDFANEAKARGNLANRLRRLRRLDEARQEIRRKIECDEQFGHAAEPWTTWAILAQIETDAGNPTAAVEAKHKATASYLAYRCDGGENHYPDGRISLAMTQALLAGDPAAAASLLQELAADSDLPNHARSFIQALQAIVAGSRDRTLADAPELDHTMAAELLFLIETLEVSFMSNYDIDKEDKGKISTY